MPKQAFDVFRNISVFYSGTFAFMAGIITVLLMDKGLDLAHVGMYFALYSAGCVLLEIPTGAFADAYGRKKSILLSFFFQIVFILGFIVFPNGALFVGFALVASLADSLLSGAAEAYAVDILVKRGKTDYTHSLLSSAKGWQSLTFLIGAIVGGYVADISPIYPLLLCMLFASTGFLYSIFYLKSDAPKKDFAKKESEIFAKMKEAAHHVQENPSLRMICIMTLLVGFGTSGLFMYWQPMVKEIAGFDNAALGMMFSAISVTILIASRVSPRLKPNWATVGFLMVGLFAFLLAASWVLWPVALIAAILIWEFIWGMYQPIEGSITNQNSPSEFRATIISIRTLLFRVGWVVLGVVLFFFGANEPRLYWVAGALCFLTAAVLAFAHSRKEKVAAQGS